MITSEIYPYHCSGGLGIAVSRMVNQLTNLGVHVTIITPAITSIPKTEHHNLITFHELSIPQCVVEQNINDRIKWNYFFAHEVLAYIKQLNKCSLIIFHDNETATGVKILKNNGIVIPILFWLHSLYDYPYESNTSILGTAVEKADWVAVSSGLMKDIEELEFPQRLLQVKYSLIKKQEIGKLILTNSLGCMPNFKLKKFEIDRIKKRKEKKVILFAGRASYTKGLGFLFEIEKKLYEKGWRIKVTGMPPENIADCFNIEWLGWLNESELIDEYKNAAFVVAPSITEGFGLSMAEAVSLNCHVISFPIGGIQDINFNIIFIELTKSERELLYWLWSEMLDSLPESHLIWERNEYKLKPIQEKLSIKIFEFINEIESKNERAKESKHTYEKNKTWGKTIFDLLIQIENQ